MHSTLIFPTYTGVGMDNTIPKFKSALSALREHAKKNRSDVPSFGGKVKAFFKIKDRQNSQKAEEGRSCLHTLQLQIGKSQSSSNLDFLSTLGPKHIFKKLESSNRNLAQLSNIDRDNQENGSNEFNVLAFSRNGKFIACGSTSTDFKGVINIYDIGTGERVRKFKHDVAISVLQFLSVSDAEVIVADIRGRIFSYNLSSHAKKNLFDFRANSAFTSAFTFDGKLMAFGLRSEQTERVDQQHGIHKNFFILACQVKGSIFSGITTKTSLSLHDAMPMQALTFVEEKNGSHIDRNHDRSRDIFVSIDTNGRLNIHKITEFMPEIRIVTLKTMLQSENRVLTLKGFFTDVDKVGIVYGDERRNANAWEVTVPNEPLR